MTSNETSAKSQKITVTLPADLVNRLNELFPLDLRKQFIAAAVERALILAEQTAVIEETAGSWSGDNHPEMKTATAIKRWSNELCKGWQI